MKNDQPDYKDYVGNSEYMAYYQDYQKRYAANIRESDRALLAIVAGLLDTMNLGEEAPRILDIGCSTGNLLLHAKSLLPTARLAGGDLAAEVIAQNQADPDLAGIDFFVMDMLDFVSDSLFDVVITNAATYCLDFKQYPTAMANIAKALKPGGWYVGFDWFHPMEQELVIVEYSRVFPKGHTLTSRSHGFVESAFADAGLEAPRFRDFDIPIDLPVPPRQSTTTHTVRTEQGKRLCFRGTLFQPWAFVTAKKRG